MKKFLTGFSAFVCLWAVGMSTGLADNTGIDCKNIKYTTLASYDNVQDVLCSGNGNGCIDSKDFKVQLDGLDTVFTDSAVTDLLQGEESNVGKSIAIGAASGVGAAGVATAITAFVERGNISCHVGDGLKTVGFNKSGSIESLKDFYVKWNLNLPDIISLTGVADCSSWAAQCKTIADLDKCVSAQVIYKPNGQTATITVPGGCMVSGNVCVENSSAARTHGACE